MRTYGIIILVCGLLLTGCGEKETATSTEAAPSSPIKPTVVEQVEKTAESVAKQTTEMVETGTQLAKDIAADAKLTVNEIVATVAEDVTAVTGVAKQKTAEIVDSSKQEIVAVKEQLKQDGTQLLNNLPKNPAANPIQSNDLLPSVTTMASAPKTVVTEVQASEKLVIENKNGNVTLPHAEHGKLYGCSACHGDAVPGPFELGKDTAHAMCKGCHKEKGGPIKCSGCHKK